METKENTENSKKIKIGIFAQFLTTTSIIFYLLSYLNKNFYLIYSNITMFTFTWYEIYRIITGIFVTDNLFDLAFNIFFIITILNHVENREGTTKTIARFFINVIIIQFLVNIIHIALFYYHPLILSFSLKPMPAISIAFIIRHVLLTDTKYIETYGGYKLNDRWVLVMSIITFLITNLSEFKIESLLSLYYGFLMCKFSKHFDTFMNDERIISFEKNDTYKSIVNLEGWVHIEECYFKIVPASIKEDDIEIIDEI